MLIKLDEDIPRSLADLLSAAGHSVATVVEQGLGGSSDAALWPIVQAEGRFLIIADKNFADIRSHPPGAHMGVLLLRPDEDGIPALMSLLKALLERQDLAALAGAVSVATARGIRIRRGT